MDQVLKHKSHQRDACILKILQSNIVVFLLLKLYEIKP
jgi:hypothetical protein